eukprot:7663436-Heterocapsa_arctica.AAC.1
MAAVFVAFQFRADVVLFPGWPVELLEDALLPLFCCWALVGLARRAPSVVPSVGREGLGEA